MQDPRYPIGKYIVQPFSEKLLREWLNDIKYLPQHIENAILNLDEAQINTPYRDGGWTVKQLVHHVADSHMNAYMRFKLALTEDNPTIRPYDQTKWAELIDSKETPEISLFILTGIHKRWVALMKNMTVSDWARPLKHPEHDRQLTLAMISQQYKWHCEHHLQHILQLRNRRSF